MEAEIASWDSVASEYLLEEKNNFKQDPFLKFMDEKVRLCKDMQVLDVGCGAGAYSCRIAERTGSVTGVDFSPRMIEEGENYVRKNHIKNVKFLERNWHTCDGEEFRGKYDIALSVNLQGAGIRFLMKYAKLQGTLLFDASVEKQIKEYLRSVSVNNVVCETIETTLTSVFWPV